LTRNLEFCDPNCDPNYFTVFLGSSLDEVEREFIRRTTAFADGNKARASEMLRVPCRTLYGKLERYDARHKSMADLTGTDTAQRAMIA
jgi:DNA-binding NtrC family response regulator